MLCYIILCITMLLSYSPLLCIIEYHMDMISFYVLSCSIEHVGLILCNIIILHCVII